MLLTKVQKITGELSKMEVADNANNYEGFSIEDNIQYINEQLNNGISMLTIEKEHYRVGIDTITKKRNKNV